VNPEVRQSQIQKVAEAFRKAPATMLMIARQTGIERAGVCRYVATLRKADQIYFVRKGLCPITRHTANFLTTNEAYRPTLKEWTLF